MIRIGHGYDLHRYGGDRPLVLAGVKIPCNICVDAHSDGDVIFHAITDACLGALGERDIGSLFPDTDSTHEGRSSIEFLTEVLRLMAEQSWLIQSVDVTVIAQYPHLSPYAAQIRTAIAQACHISVSGFKAKTREKLGSIGAGKAIEAHAVVCIVHQRLKYRMNELFPHEYSEV